MGLDLNESNVSDWTSLVNNVQEIKRMKKNFLRLFNFSSNGAILNDNIIFKKYESIRKNRIENLEFSGDDQVIVKYSFHDTELIMIFDWINGNTIGTIPNRNIKKQEFCWIEHLNEIFCHQSNQIEEVCSLFSTTGNLVRCVIVILNNIHQVNSISNNKNNFEVYLNVFDKTCSKNSILILDKDFLFIRTIANELRTWNLK